MPCLFICQCLWIHLIFPSTVFQRFYHGPTPQTTNATLVLTQLEEILNQANNQTGKDLSEHGNADGHVLISLPASLVEYTKEIPILCLLLMVGTLWLGYTLYLIKRRSIVLVSCFIRLKCSILVCLNWALQWKIHSNPLSSDRWYIIHDVKYTLQFMRMIQLFQQQRNISQTSWKSHAMSSEVCYSFHSPYLNDKIREVVSDCALPISVVMFSFIGSYLFVDIRREYSSPPVVSFSVKNSWQLNTFET